MLALVTLLHMLSDLLLVQMTVDELIRPCCLCSK